MKLPNLPFIAIRVSRHRPFPRLPAGLIAVCISATPALSQEMTVQGRILERATLAPVPGATVRIAGDGGTPVATDASGAFLIRRSATRIGGRDRNPGTAKDRLERIVGAFYRNGIWSRPDGRAASTGAPGRELPGTHATESVPAAFAKAVSSGRVLEISMPGLASKSITVEDSARDLGDIVLEYPPRRLGVGAPPSYGSIVLFDGSRASLDSNWQMWMGDYRRKNGLVPTPITWELLKDPVDQGMTMRTCCRIQWGDEDLVTKRKFKDFQLHVEFNLVSPPRVGGGNPGPANSGIYLQSLYEVQIKDDYGKAVLGDHDEAAILNEFAAPKNEGRPRGAWQAYDITYRAARFAGGARSEKARLTLYWNGKPAHEDKQTANEHAVGISSDSLTDAPRGLKLQNEGHDVRFRNVWIKELDLKTPDTRVGY